MGWVGRIALVYFFSFLASCGMLGPISDERAAATKNIGVVSYLGDTFYGNYLGFTVFGNESFEKRVADWSVDALIEKEIIKMLGEYGVYDSVVTIAESQKFIDYSTYKIDVNGLLDIARSQGLDTVLIARKAGYDNWPGMRGGYGFHQHGLNRCVYTLYVIEAMDVAEKKHLAWYWGFQGWGEPCFLNKTSIEWKSSFDAYSDAERETMKKEVYELITGGVDYSLRGLHLLPSKSEPAPEFGVDKTF